MNQKSLRLALNTVDAQRVEIIGQVISGQGWQILPFVAQPMRIDWLQQLQADLILIDLDLPNALSQVADLKRTLPGVPVLVLATQEHLVKLQDAFLAGAADFVSFPVDKSYFTATVQRVLQTRSNAIMLPSPTKSSRMIAVTSLRGGAGRSTVAANLAIALHQHTKTETILTEAHHSMGHLSLMLNLHPRHTLANLTEGEHFDRDIVQAYLQQHSSGIHLLAAPTELPQLVELTTETWRQTLNLLAEIAPYVVVDTAAAADDILSEVLMRADDIVIVSTPDIPGLRCTVNLLETLRAEEAIRARIHVILNRAGVRGGLDANMVQKQLKEKDFITIPEDTPLATYALNRGVPFVLSHPRAVISRRIQMLVDNIVGQPESVVGEQKPKTSHGFLSLLPVSGNGKGGTR
ncbi:MAG: cellulose synthase operon protein YhjQ/BcsQ [Caldilineaceae bacterium]